MAPKLALKLAPKLGLIPALFAAQRENRLGDFAILKAELLGAQVAAAIAPQLEAVVGYYPPIDLDALLQLPQESLGYAYAHHMRSNHLTPLTISPDLAAIARRNVFALRYVITHDIFHVLLGFDTSYAGEMGVLAFAVAQGYSRFQDLAIALAQWIYPLLAPGQRAAIAANRQRGTAMGKAAACLLAYRFEDHWDQPLETLRQDMGLNLYASGRTVITP